MFASNHTISPFCHLDFLPKKRSAHTDTPRNLNLKLKSTRIIDLILFRNEGFYLNSTAPDIIIGNIGPIHKICNKAILGKMQFGKESGLNALVCGCAAGYVQANVNKFRFYFTG